MARNSGKSSLTLRLSTTKERVTRKCCDLGKGRCLAISVLLPVGPLESGPCRSTLLLGLQATGVLDCLGLCFLLNHDSTRAASVSAFANQSMKNLIYVYLTLVGGLVIAILYSLLERLFPRRCPGCRRLTLPVPMTIEGLDAVVCSRADCRYKGSDATWRQEIERTPEITDEDLPV